MRNTIIAAMTAMATVFAVSTAEAATVTVIPASADISGLGGSQGYGATLTGGMAGDAFVVDFVFKVVDSDAEFVGATSIENLVTANLSFTSIELYDSSNALLASGTVGTLGLIDFGELSSNLTLNEGDTYYVRTSGTFVTAGNAAIGGTVSLSPVPVPAALPLMVSAMAAVGLVGARRKKS